MNSMKGDPDGHGDHAAVAEMYARGALGNFALSSSSSLQLLRYGENGVFRVDTPQGERFALRVHRPGYHEREAIQSELRWMDALRQFGVETPRTRAGMDGALVQIVDGPARAPARYCVLFEWIEGVPLGRVGTEEVYEFLGGIMAKMHEQSQRWRSPSGFSRQRWDEEGLVGAHPVFGRFDGLTDWPPAVSEMIRTARDEIRKRLLEFGRGESRFGLIHADLTPWNILLRRGEPFVLDFDDCGFGWYLFDIATALWPHEGDPQQETLHEALLTGYRRMRPISDEELEMLPVFFMARRFAGLGWVNTRSETAHAQERVASRITSTPDALMRFLKWADAH